MFIARSEYGELLGHLSDCGSYTKCSLQTVASSISLPQGEKFPRLKTNGSTLVPSPRRGVSFKSNTPSKRSSLVQQQ